MNTRDKITLGRITRAKIIQVTITQSMNKFTQGKITHGKDTLVTKMLWEEESDLPFFCWFKSSLLKNIM